MLPLLGTVAIFRGVCFQMEPRFLLMVLVKEELDPGKMNTWTDANWSDTRPVPNDRQIPWTRFSDS